MRKYIAVIPTLLTLSLMLSAQAPRSAGVIYKESARAVVSIEAKNDKGAVEWTGTGFLVSSDGKILTNYHVIRNSKLASIRLANGDVYDGVEVSDVDRRKDIALLKIKALDLPTVRVGNTGTLEIGDAVYSLSNPLGLLDNTLSEGIVSGIRQLDGFHVLQITAPISHGSSGGPLFNAKGEVVGITSATIQDGQSLNFAIPIDYARGMLASPNQPRPLASVYDPEPESSVKSTSSEPSETDPQTKDEVIDGSWSATFADAKGSGHLDFNIIQNSEGHVLGTYTSSLGGGGQIKGVFLNREFKI